MLFLILFIIHVMQMWVADKKHIHEYLFNTSLFILILFTHIHIPILFRICEMYTDSGKNIYLDLFNFYFHVDI